MNVRVQWRFVVVLAQAARRSAARSTRMPSKRCSVRAISTAGAVNGAFCSMTLVARGHLDVPVAAVERLGPDQRRRLGGAPGEVARPVGTPWTGTRSASGSDAIV